MAWWSKGAGEVRIEYLPLEEIIRAPRNAKDHDLGAIHQSYQKFGYVSPMIINETTGRLVAGHGRLDSLIQMQRAGQDAPERIRIKDGQWFVPIVRGISFESDVEAEAYLIADNRTVELGGWNEAELAPILSGLAAQEALEGTGYDQDDLDGLLQRFADDDGSQSNAGSGTGGDSLITCPKCKHEFTV